MLQLLQQAYPGRSTHLKSAVGSSADTHNSERRDSRSLATNVQNQNFEYHKHIEVVYATCSWVTYEEGDVSTLHTTPCLFRLPFVDTV